MCHILRQSFLLLISSSADDKDSGKHARIFAIVSPISTANQSGIAIRPTS